MSQSLYDNMRDNWLDFLNGKMYLPEPRDEEHLADMYDELASDFCKEHRYSPKTEEFAFHGRWWDTFADDYYQILEKGGWEGFPEPDTTSYSDTKRTKEG